MPRTPRGDDDGIVMKGAKWRVNLAVRRSRLPAPARLIMMVLVDMADVGTAELPPRRTPSTAQLALETDLSESTVKTHRKALEDAGWVEFTRPTPAQAARHEPGQYKLFVPAASGGRLLTPASAAPGPARGSSADPRESARGSAADPAGGQDVTPPGVSSRPARGSAPDPLISTYDQDDKERTTAAAAVREAVERVCGRLADRVEGNGSPRPPVTDAWRSAAASLLYEDGHTEQQLLDAVDFAHGDDFWTIHVVSPAKLREHYHALRLSAQRARNRAAQKAGAATPIPPREIQLAPPNPAPPGTAATHLEAADTRRRIAEARAQTHACETVPGRRGRPALYAVDTTPADPTDPDEGTRS